jgi:hypothetical protein
MCQVHDHRYGTGSAASFSFYRSYGKIFANKGFIHRGTLTTLQPRSASVPVRDSPAINQQKPILRQSTQITCKPDEVSYDGSAG